MYSKLQDGSFMVCGFVARDAEIKTTQSGKTLTTFSVKVAEVPAADGKREAKWTSCQAWHDIARTAAAIRKGDTVFAIGKLTENEYEGKTYKNLVCEFISIMKPVQQTVPPQQEPRPAGTGALSQYEEILGDGDLPF